MYKIPQEIKDRIPDYFYYAFAGELFSVYGCVKGMHMFAQNEINDYFDYDTGTGAWYQAFKETCRKLEMEWLVEYYEALEWYDSDAFDSEIEKELHNTFYNESNVNCYYRYLSNKTNDEVADSQRTKVSREPRVPNKYDLTPDKIRQLRVLDKEAIHKKPFCSNVNYPGCGQLSGSICDDSFDFEDAYYSILVDDDGVIDFSVTVMETCNYIFDKFYDPEEMDNDVDLEIQEMILERINRLIDDGVLGLPREE